ncbi:MAG: GDYXXLXY domain-containing protein [Halanaerobacter sp.]
MHQKFIIGLFILLAVIQLAVPGVMIAKRELTLKNGEEFKFITAPVDPYDAFRGRYVSLNFSQSQIPLSQDLEIERNQWVYAHLKKDKAGFAKIHKITLDPPAKEDYLKVKVRYIDKRREEVNLELPFDRYYLEEDVAKVAEKYYQQLSRREEIASYVVVRVDSGFGVLEELYLDGVPILEYVREHLEE